MSYNNYVDADAARRTVFDYAEPAVAIIKHANPCGIAIGADVAEAHRKAHACDPVSAFGGVIAVNRPVSVAMAEQVADMFTEVIVAPAYDDGAVRGPHAARRTSACWSAAGRAPGPASSSAGSVAACSCRPSTASTHRATTRRRGQLASGAAADESTLADLVFAWRACRAVKSNAILLASDGASVGIGMGQVNRVDSARLAVSRPGGASGRVGGGV